jgi:LPXTG-motif cell wall-anchored protein
MSTARLMAGAATAFAGLALWAGPAVAQVECRYPCPPPGDVAGGGEERPGGVASGEQPRGEEAGVELVTGGPAAQQATAPSGSLPVTGGDVAGLLLLGGGAIAGGAVLVRRSRRHQPA